MTNETQPDTFGAIGISNKHSKFIDDYLSYLLARAGHVVYKEFHAVVHAAGLGILEWRVLATLSDGDGLTIGELAREVLTQQPTLTKLIQRMERAGWVSRGADPADARRTLVFETAQGQAVIVNLLAKAKQHELELLTGIGATEVATLKDVLRILIRRSETVPPKNSTSSIAPLITLRAPQPGDMGWVVQQHGEIYAREYGWNSDFEAMVADIVANYLRKFQPEWERCWIAERNGQRLGSVFVVRKSKNVAQLRMLILTPEARGLGLGGRLTDECIHFARAKGYKKMHLWTNNCLDAARAIYAKRGFKPIKSMPYQGFGQNPVGEYWELVL